MALNWLEKLVELHPRLRVIYTTGGGQADRMTAQFVEDSAFLLKPYTGKQLMRALIDQLILARGVRVNRTL